MTKMFLKTLNSLYYERMVARAPNDFTEMVGIWVRLEEGFREGRLTKEAVSSSGMTKYGNSFHKNKEGDISSISKREGRENREVEVIV